MLVTHCALKSLSSNVREKKGQKTGRGREPARLPTWPGAIAALRWEKFSRRSPFFVSFSKVCACLFPSQGCTHKSACHSVTVLPSGSRQQTEDLSSHVSNQALPSIPLWKAALVHGAGRNRWGHLHTLRPLSTVFFSFSSLCWTAVCFHELLSFAHSLRFGHSRLWLSGILYMATAFFQISLNRMLFFFCFLWCDET